jgi:uncharacterized membrane protein
MTWPGDPRRRSPPRARRYRVNRPQLVYWPLARPFLLVVVMAAVVLVALLQIGVVTYALRRLGIGPVQAALVLIVGLLGGAVNLPVARLRGQAVPTARSVSVFGIRYLIPVLTTRDTIIAVNVGGAVVPTALSVYLIVHDHLTWRALAAVVLVSLAVHAVARPVRGLGIAVPTLLPGVFAAAAAVLLHPVALAGLAYVGGTLGTLIGADLTNLPKVRRLGAPVASIGGAGTFDGVFLTGIIAVLLAGLV